MIINTASAGTLQLNDLCVQKLSGGPPHLATWAIRLTPDKEGLARYLQNVLRILAWQSDSSLHYDDDNIPEDFRDRCRVIASAFELAVADFASIGRWLDNAGEEAVSLTALGKAIRLISTAGDEVDPAVLQMLEETLAPLDPALRIVGMKHLGDLALDADQPAAAAALYRSVERSCERFGNPAWSELIGAVADMTRQSLATVSGMTDSAQSTYTMLEAVQKPETLVARPLLAINAAVGAMQAGYQSEETLFQPDVRAAVLNAPQLQQSHDLGIPLDHWLNGKFADAHRRFWAVLRRLNALGGSTHSTEAMAFYGRSICDELHEQIGRQRQPDAFKLALQLIIGSGREDAVGPETNKDDLVDAYVTEQTIAFATEIAQRHAGVHRERQNVLVKLFAAWLATLGSEKEDLAQLLIAGIASLTNCPPGNSFIKGHSLPQTSLNAIKEIVRKRPEFVAGASQIITDAILVGLESKQFYLTQAGLEAAVNCAEGLEADHLKLLANVILSLLEEGPPSEGAWPIVSPAITFIASQHAQALWPTHRKMAVRSAQAILRHGLGDATESTRLVALLEDIIPYLDTSVLHDKRIQDVVQAVRETALKPNHSGVARDIAVLFSAPGLVGREGIDDAVRGLLVLLGTAETQRPSIAMATGYQPLSTLTYRLDSIVSALSLSQEEVKALLDPIVTSLEKFWKVAQHNALLFAPFAIPFPTAPNPVIVQNWAFVTLGFGRRINAFDRLSKVVDEAARNSELDKPIALAKAVRLTAGDPIALDPAAIREERREPFYAALGERLNYIATLPAIEDTSLAVAALVERCLVLGPDGLDAGAFVVALREENLDLPAAAVTGYRRRLERNSRLMPGLFPLLRSLTTPEPT